MSHYVYLPYRLLITATEAVDLSRLKGIVSQVA